MKILAALDNVFRRLAEVEPWQPPPATDVVYAGDPEWQRAHLWDSLGEDHGFHGAFRGPSILHHPDLPYALENGWRVVGGDKQIDHQSRGETSSGSTYLYKIGKDGLIHEANLAIGPEDAHSMADRAEERGQGYDSVYGDVPSHNWRHLLMGEGATSEGPEMHATLRDLVDDELARSGDPKRGYKDFEPLSRYRSENQEGNRAYDDFERRHQHAIRRAWETGSNQPYKHYNDPIPDPYAGIEDMPRAPRRGQEPGPREDYGDLGGSKHPRYGSERG